MSSSTTHPHRIHRQNCKRTYTRHILVGGACSERFQVRLTGPITLQLSFLNNSRALLHLLNPIAGWLCNLLVSFDIFDGVNQDFRQGGVPRIASGRVAAVVETRAHGEQASGCQRNVWAEFWGGCLVGGYPISARNYHRRNCGENRICFSFSGSPSSTWSDTLAGSSICKAGTSGGGDSAIVKVSRGTGVVAMMSSPIFRTTLASYVGEG